MGGFIQRAQSYLEASGYGILAALLIFFFGYLIIRILLRFTKLALVKSRVDNSLVNFMLTLVKFLLFLVLILYILSLLDVPLTGLVTALSALTLAIGLALQNIIASVANGFMIVATRPFKVGDYVDIGGTSGTVKELTLMHTVMNTPDNKRVMMPNSSVFTSVITNYSTNELRRMDIVIGVDYDNDVEQVRSILLNVAASHPLTLETPQCTVRFNCDDSDQIAFTIRLWTRNEDYWSLYYDLKEQCMKALFDAGILLAYPQLTVSYRNTKEDK